MWLHRRSEEPSCTQVECYWNKSLLSKVGTRLKSITAKEIAKDVLKEVEEKTRDQSENTLWHELRFARVKASKAYEISRCKTSDNALVSMILGSEVPETPTMKRDRVLEQKVLRVVGKMLGKHIKKWGFFISKLHPMIAVSPDGRGWKTIKKCYAQLQLQMYVCDIKKSYFCDSNFENNMKVNIIDVDFNEEYIHTLLKALLLFWKSKIFPLLFKMSKT
ncbi:hypothetical protein ACJJTC_010853 [Scirpophaga incertulas]